MALPFLASTASAVSANNSRKPTKGGPAKIPVTGLDAVVVDFEFEVGAIIAEGGPSSQYQYIVKSAFLTYNTPSHLEMRSSPQKEYCSLQIYLELVALNESDDYLLPPRRHPIQEVEVAFHNIRQKWKDSDDFQQLMRILDQSNRQVEIRKIVGFACSSMSREGSVPKHFIRPAKQHALLLTLQEIYTKSGHEADKTACYMQDPVYNEVDKSVLEDLGMAVLDDPDGFLEVDETSVVVSITANVPVKEIVLENAKLAIIIWDSFPGSVEEADAIVEGLREPDPCTDPFRSRVILCLRDYYDEFAFPNSEGGFENVSIYIRRQSTKSFSTVAAP